MTHPDICFVCLFFLFVCFFQNILNWHCAQTKQHNDQSDQIVKMKTDTVMILSFRTDRPGQTVQTQIRLLLEEQSDQGLHCLPFRLHGMDSLLYGKAT